MPKKVKQKAVPVKEPVPEDLLAAMEDAKEEVFDQLHTNVLPGFKTSCPDQYNEADEKYRKDTQNAAFFWLKGLPKERNVLGEGINYKKFTKSGYLPFLDYTEATYGSGNAHFYQRALDLEHFADDRQKYLVLFGRVYTMYVIEGCELQINISHGALVALEKVYESYKAEISEEEIRCGIAPHGLAAVLGIAKYTQYHVLLLAAFPAFCREDEYKAAPAKRKGGSNATFWFNGGEPKEHKKATFAGKKYKEFPKSGYKTFLKFCKAHDDKKVGKAIEFYQRAREIDSWYENREKYLTLVLGASEYEGILSTKPKKKSALDLPRQLQEELAETIRKYSEEIAVLFKE